VPVKHESGYICIWSMYYVVETVCFCVCIMIECVHVWCPTEIQLPWMRRWMMQLESWSCRFCLWNDDANSSSWASWISAVGCKVRIRKNAELGEFVLSSGMQNGQLVEVIILRHDARAVKYEGGPLQGGLSATLCVSSRVHCYLIVSMQHLDIQSLVMQKYCHVIHLDMLSIICTMDVVILCNLNLSNVVVWPPSCAVRIPNGLHICGTGTLALKGNLSAGEMLEQLVHASQIPPTCKLYFC
jgi:hypothetical protein